MFTNADKILPHKKHSKTSWMETLIFPRLKNEVNIIKIQETIFTGSILKFLNFISIFYHYKYTHKCDSDYKKIVLIDIFSIKKYEC